MFSYLIYTSKASKPMDTADLHLLLNESLKWNLAHHITGVLLYIKDDFLSKNDGRFIQVLEGSDYDINFIFQKIRSDPRHRQIVVLNQSVCKKRNFPDWSLGFKSLTFGEYQEVPSFFELNEGALTQIARQKFNAPLNMLQSFYLMHSKTPNESSSNKEVK